ncbi:hypothetical protein Tco_1061897 [Tanacetum coccineum]
MTTTNRSNTLLPSQPPTDQTIIMVLMVSYEAFACPCGAEDVVLRESYKPKTRGSSTPPRYSLGASTPQSFSPVTSRKRRVLKLQALAWKDNGCLVMCEDGYEERYSGCIIAAHAPDTPRMLVKQATYDEQRILGSFNYVYSDIFLHHDKSLMPKNSTAWSAWNDAEH